MTFTAKDVRAYQSEVKNNTPRFIREHRAAFDIIIDAIIKQIQKSVHDNPEAQNCTIDITLLIKSAHGIDPIADSGEFINKAYNLNVSKVTFENEDQIQIGGYEEWSYDFAPRS